MTPIAVYLDYKDKYVEPKIRSALLKYIPDIEVEFVKSVPEDLGARRLLQWAEYEALDFETVYQNSQTLVCSYVIRKALIRKHHLPNTVSHFVSKRPNSILKNALPLTLPFQLDYAEFLDEALVEAYELRNSMENNIGRQPHEREWWMLKAGMADRGNGIRIFSTEEELSSIFEEWEGDDGEFGNEGSVDEHSDQHGIVTSQLRHFVAQKYVHPPLLLNNGKKFHIRTYVTAVGSLKVYVYRQMLALFAGEKYSPPWTAKAKGLAAHLTNTCIQGEEGLMNVMRLWDLPMEKAEIESIYSKICLIAGDLFEAAAREQRIHFQSIPNAFEIFGLDFLIDDALNVFILEVNSYPDFKQTGDAFGSLIQGLFDGVVSIAVAPFFGYKEHKRMSDMELVKDIELAGW